MRQIIIKNLTLVDYRRNMLPLFVWVVALAFCANPESAATTQHVTVYIPPATIQYEQQLLEFQKTLKSRLQAFSEERGDFVIDDSMPTYTVVVYLQKIQLAGFEQQRQQKIKQDQVLNKQAKVVSDFDQTHKPLNEGVKTAVNVALALMTAGGGMVYQIDDPQPPSMDDEDEKIVETNISNAGLEYEASIVDVNKKKAIWKKSGKVKYFDSVIVPPEKQLQILLQLVGNELEGKLPYLKTTKKRK